GAAACGAGTGRAGAHCRSGRSVGAFRCRARMAVAGSIGAMPTRGVMNPLNQEPLLSLDALPDGALAEAQAVIDGESESLVVYRSGEAVRAWLNVCPHAGRRLDWAPGQFLKS